MTAATHINPEALHSSPAFSWVVRVPAGADVIYIGGQNGVGADGTVVGPGMAEQARQALANLGTCLEAAGAEVTNIVKWTILYVSDHERLLTLAGRRMYDAKDAGRNRVCVTPPASSSECA